MVIDCSLAPYDTSFLGAYYEYAIPQVGPAMPQISYAQPVLPSNDHLSGPVNSGIPDVIYG